MKKIFAIMAAFALLVCVFSGCKKEPAPVVPSEPVGEETFEETGDYFARDGVSEYRILLAQEPEPAERTAAYTLQKLFGEITGVTLDVVTDAGRVRTTDHYISIGENKLSDAAGPAHDNLNTDGFRIKLVDNTLFIVGEHERGTLYGVYEFLERETGAVFLNNKYDYLPEKTTVPVRRLDITEIPDFRVRTHYYQPTSYDADLNAKLRFHSYYNYFNGESIGGGFSDTWNAGVHSMGTLVPQSSYYAAHNDWFSSGGTYWQPCFSSGLNNDGTIDDSDSLIREVIRIVKESILDNENLRWIMLGQNDGGAECTCDRCTAQLAAIGGKRSGQIVMFVNAVAREVKEWMAQEGIDREINFVTLSYTWSILAPVHTNEAGEIVADCPQVVPRDDVYIMFAPLDACYNHALNDPDCAVNSDKSLNTMEDWRKICDNFIIFDYNINFGEFLSWYPNLSVIRENLEYYREIGVTGIIAEGALCAQNFYQQDLESWLFGKLMWNVDQNVYDLISQYNRAYFGEEAGAVMDELVGFFETHFRTVSETMSQWMVQHALIFSTEAPWLVSPQTLNAPFLDRAEAYVDRMYEIIENDLALGEGERQQYIENIEHIDVQVRYMRYENYDAVSYTTDAEKFRFMNEFFDLCIKLDVQRFYEAGPFISQIRTDLGY